MKKLAFFVSILSSFCLGIFLSPKILNQQFLQTQLENQYTERREKGFELINPLLECEYNSSNSTTVNFQKIKKSLDPIIDANPDESISLYYRDLNNGPWYGINEYADFAPQSLLKIPVAISYMKLFEDDPSLLQKTIKYEIPINSNLLPEQDLQLGIEYQISHLIERSLTLSDNIAFNLLVQNIDSAKIKKTHEDLGITYPSKETPEDFISVRSYSSLFRILYNSSYLSRKNSEYILKILTLTDYSNGLKAGVPAEVTVAHKYGILNNQSDIKQLHDCGIIYYPDKPYILCVMTRGKDLEKLKKTVENISKNVYEAVVAE